MSWRCDSSAQQLAQLQQQAAADRATIDVATQKTAMGLASYNPMAKGISLPKGNGLFRLVNDLSTGTVIEANALYVDGSESLGTDYLLNLRGQI